MCGRASVHLCWGQTGTPAPCSIISCLIPLGQTLSLNLELGWKTASPANLCPPPIVLWLQVLVAGLTSSVGAGDSHPGPRLAQPLHCHPHSDFHNFLAFLKVGTLWNSRFFFKRERSLTSQVQQLLHHFLKILMSCNIVWASINVRNITKL